MFKLIKFLSKEYDKYYSIEINSETGEIYYRPFWFKPLVIIMGLINHLCFPITTKLEYFDKKNSYMIFDYSKYRFKGKHWVLPDYFE